MVANGPRRARPGDGRGQAPRVNATFDAEAEVILVHPAVHLGLAVATERGLLVPRVANVNTMSLVQLAGAIGTTTEAARAGTLPPADLTGSTISLTNVGVFGVDGGTPSSRRDGWRSCAWAGSWSVRGW